MRRERLAAGTSRFWRTAVALKAFALTASFLCAQAELTVAVTSPRADLLFTDAEILDVRVVVHGASSSAIVDWHVEEAEGPWCNEGRVTVSACDGVGEGLLPLDLPGRGHYTLVLHAVSGDETADAVTSLGVVFPPAPPDLSSPWGIFHAPAPIDPPGDPAGAKAIAASMRRLGVSWARLNFWSWSYDTVSIERGSTGPRVTADITQWKAYVRALRGEGIHIMGGVAQCPAALSSRPGDLASESDRGPVAFRVRPRDYAEWDALMTWLATELHDEIDVWEIWNEPDFQPGFWVGSPEEFAQLVHYTSAALRAGNPNARIAGCGFVNAQEFADRLFELGVGRDLDILSVHYTDHDALDIAAWQALLNRHGLDLPIWNSEERAEAPLLNMASGISRSFKFLHADIPGYDAFRPLVNLDLTPRPSAISFAAAAHCLGAAVFVDRSNAVPGYDLFLFRRGEETVAAFRVKPFHNLFGREYGCAATLAVIPLDPDVAPRLTDRFGRSAPICLDDGKAAVVLDSSLMFLNGARRVEVLGAAAQEPGEPRTFLFEAEAGHLGPGWCVARGRAYSGGRYAAICADADPGPEGYCVEVGLDLPTAGSYEVFFSGNTLTRLKPPRSLSPFAWTIDNGPPNAVDREIPGLPDIANAGEGLFKLGEMELAAGTHTFTLRLTDRRQSPDTRFALWFDAVVLRGLDPKNERSTP